MSPPRRPPSALRGPLPGVRGRLAAGLLALAATLPAAAHDFWIEPSTYRPEPGQRVALRHRVGERFLGDALPRDESLLLRFVALTGEGEKPVPGVDGADPAGVLTAGGGGTVVVAYESRGTVAELGREKLLQYVDEEGLAPQLPPGWQAPASVRDRFSRSAKCLLVVAGPGPAAQESFSHLAGLPLELVPLADPGRLAGGGELPVRLLRQGEPAPGIRVTAFRRLDPAHPVRSTTDERGEVRLALPRGGVWLVKAVKLEPAAPGSGADFESLWASLTFEVPER